jgi:hypothetical protein
VTAATINLRIQPFRLLTKTDAAHYCRRPLKKFDVECPVRPIEMANGDHLWDVRDLDIWIDGLKAGTKDEATADSLIALLK